MAEHLVKVNPNLCVGCGFCEKDCPTKSIGVVKQKARMQAPRCIQCGHCVAVCPKGAVSMTGFTEPPLAFAEQPLVDGTQLLRALKARRSIRQFTTEEIPEEVLKQIIEAGRFTPTAKNVNSISYVVLKKEKAEAEALAVQFFRKMMPLMQKVYPAAKGREVDDAFFFKGAAAAIVVISKDKVSASLAASNMALMAESANLGVLYSGFFAMAANMSKPLKKMLGLQGKEKVVTTLVLGYPDVRYFRTAQKEAARVEWR